LPRADFARDARHFGGEGRELVDHRVDGVLELEDLAACLDHDLLVEIAVGDGGGHARDVADLACEVRRHEVDVLGQPAPRAADALHLGLAAELALRADFPRDACHFRGEARELVDHRVDRLLELADLSARVDGDLLVEVAVGHRRRDLRDVAHLVGQVRRHVVDVLGQVLPGAGDAADVGLAAELAFRADLLGDARHFGGEGRELVDHRVDGVLELEDLAARLDRDLLVQVARRDRGGHARDVAHLVGEVGRHEVDVLGQPAPGAADALDFRLAAELAVRADFARHARHLVGEGRTAGRPSC
jgi:hypothetical protein